MREVALVVDIVCRVLFHLKSVTDATKKVIRDELGEALWVAHEELVTGTRQQFWEEYFVKVIMQVSCTKT